jgi:hypothetical protein
MPARTNTLALCAALSFLAAGSAFADDPDPERLRRIPNPVSDLATLPLRNKFESGVGPNDAFRYTLSVEPVVPVKLTPDWLLITRTILPVTRADTARAGCRQ